MLSTTWRAALRGNRRPAQLVTIVSRTQARLARLAGIHPAEQPGALRYSTDLATNISTVDSTLAFWPFVSSWIEVEQRLDLVTRQVLTSPVQVRIVGAARFPLARLREFGTGHLNLRIDLWSPGVGIREAFRIFEGNLSLPASYDADGGVTLGAEVLTLENLPEFPPGNPLIDRDEFPELPDYAVERYSRQAILGAFPYDIFCPPISDTQCYVTDSPPLTIAPAIVRVNGEPVTDWSYDIGRMAASETPFSRLTFPTGTLDPTTIVTAQGGVGITPNRHPIAFLVEDVGEKAISARGLALLDEAAGFQEFSTVFNSAEGAGSLVTERLLPQTDLFAFPMGDEVDFFRFTSGVGSRRLGTDSELHARVIGLTETTSDDDIVNAVEVFYQRNVFAVDDRGVGTRRFLLDKDHNASPALAALLSRSEQLYGRRYRAILAPDIATDDPSRTPQLAIRLAEHVLGLRAFGRETGSYDARLWLLGLEHNLGQRAVLTDAENSISSAASILVGRTFRATGVRFALRRLG